MSRFVFLVVSLACACYGKRLQTPKTGAVPPESFAQLDAQGSAETIPFKSLATLLSATSNPASAFQVPGVSGTVGKVPRVAAPNMEADVSDLKDLAKKLNPVVGFWDPLQLAEQNFWETGNEATQGFLRHAEIKHGRVAMAAFVGYLAQSNGITFPWKLTGQVSFSDIAAAGSPPEQWDALPTGSKLQIIGFIGFLEFWSETSSILEQEGQKHYMRGGKPGFFPSFEKMNKEIHPVPLNLYDPFGLNKKKTQEQLDKKLLAEVNNGRLAMLGIMAFLAEQKVPGAVPALSSLGLKPYAGEVMGPLSAGDASLPFVKPMLDSTIDNFYRGLS